MEIEGSCRLLRKYLWGGLIERELTLEVISEPQRKPRWGSCKALIPTFYVLETVRQLSAPAACTSVSAIHMSVFIPAFWAKARILRCCSGERRTMNRPENGRSGSSFR
uniref:Uncharacterized protein n=1 Tax=Candidatus Kentrum sp. FM TaxID=2126340 RepID=A0A450SGI5_9GAMM|nr:MAG: hypothetical protein BECKFM1743A_GA0114220_1003110 [Candidatus Kentron sp. FM]VFJ52151.1 MAG: hypothetical protein BECKFM1743C_GA0114222_101067 [Candidatus Kentron sp. FM]VFK09132.1 MAG: hypothetical protein BECKFM1743B_GA0114221_100967 [Candidatus Kentron sp. FM]